MLEKMGFGLRMNALISLSVFNKMNDYYFFIMCIVAKLANKF